MNTSATNIYIQIEEHPYGVAIIVLLFLFMIGIVATFFGHVGKGVKVVGNGLYYLTAPLHMPVKWAYKSISSSTAS